jgi:V/A-type H+-transporting ATPase subunit I
MVKAFAACRESDRHTLLHQLRRLGMLHMVAVEPDRAVSGEASAERIRQVEAALQMIQGIEPAGPRPPHTPGEAVDAIREIVQRGEEARSRLDVLHREAERMRHWGRIPLEHLQALEDAEVDLRVLIAPDRAVPYLRGRVIESLESVGRNRRLVAAIDLDDSSVSAHVEELEPPRTDRDRILAEASRLQRVLHIDQQRLAELAWLQEDLERERDRLVSEARWEEVVRSGLEEKGLYAVQGWVPEDQAAALVEGLERCRLPVAVRTVEPGPDERPPTLLRYRPWARPIGALFRILGTVPGYRELDVSSVFVIALPLFAGMIIGDAGYGLLFALFPFLAGRKLRDAIPSDLRVMLVLFGFAALVWGAVTGVWFGLTPGELLEAGGAVGALGAGLDSLQLIRGSENEARMTVIKICFIIGTLHLVTAHVQRAWELGTRESLAEIGWAVVLLGMLGVIWILFFGADGVPGPVRQAAIIGLAVGLVLVTLFSHPDRPLLGRIGYGLAGSLLPLLGTFSDTLSYIRLMAVGLASFYLGSTFNTLAAALAESTSWFLGAFVLVAGHGLNIGLILIAIFAHGVRLNVLEFSSNAGIHWTGYPYRPLSDSLVKER